MCGIYGFNFKDNALLSRMSKVLHHRGPDDVGKYVDSNVSLGQNRLSIIDLSENGRNPIYNKDKSKMLFFNGEIYNFKELREELKNLGHEFHTKTDTEPLIKGYDQWGLDIFEKLNGMFALAIYDKKKKKLILARDRLGQKPLYYYFDGKKFIFASEIKAILQCKAVKKEANEKAVIEYLTFMNTLDDKTFFTGIKQLLPGRYMEVGKTLKITKYFEPKFKYKKRNASELKEEFRSILKRSVKRHLISDVPVGAYLSGGFDSGTVVTEAVKHMNKQMNTFTIKFDASGKFDETKCSRAVAKEIGANIYEKKVTGKDFINNFEKMVYHMDEPKVGIPVISQYHLAPFVREKVKVALTGHGGDELFAGYAVFIAKQYEEILNKNFLRHPDIFFKVISDKKRDSIGYYLYLPKIIPEIKHGIIVIYHKKERDHLLTEDFLNRNDDFDSDKCVEKVYSSSKLSKDEKLQELYLKTYLPALFIAEDKMTMAASLEARIPLCDNEMIDFALSIPIKDKLQNRELKWVIKESMRGVIPDVLYSQEKRGFPTPFGVWLNDSSVMKYVKKILLSKKCIDRGLFNKDHIESLLNKRDFLSQNKIWVLLHVETWYRTFID